MRLEKSINAEAIKSIFDSLSATIGALDTGDTLPEGQFDLDTITKDWTHASDDGLFENMAVCIFAGGMKIVTLQKRWVAMREAFGNFEIAYVANLILDNLLSNNRIIRHPGKVAALISNASKIQAIQREEGSFIAYLSERLNRGFNKLSSCIVQDFAYLGPATGADFLKDIGMGGYKPDVHFTRILQRIGLWDGDASILSDVVQKITSATDLSASEIDRLLFRYGSGLKLSHSVCGENPVCGVCKVGECAYRKGAEMR